MMLTSITIPAFLKIEKGALSDIGMYLKNHKLTKVVVFFGNGLIDMFGEMIMKSFNEHDIEVLQYMELDTVNLEDITDIAFSMPNSTQTVIGVAFGIPC